LIFRQSGVNIQLRSPKVMNAVDSGHLSVSFRFAGLPAGLKSDGTIITAEQANFKCRFTQREREGRYGKLFQPYTKRTKTTFIFR
ncbi:MAG: hypothetical protein SPF74_00735, partial [Candidatus Limivicinus sp.]|nr:hypothetical protein [Candidatus Limivicinus sp.]